MRSSPNSTPSRTSWRVVSPTSTSPGFAACCSRAPMFTSAPITMLRSLGVPTATWPVFTPTRTPTGTGSSSRAPMRSARSTIASPARTPRSASSSCSTGTPKTPSTASPMNPSALPPNTVISSVTMPWNAASTSRNRSGSRLAASSVEPARSAKTTVTTRRSEAAGTATGAPQFGQKLASSGSGCPHRGHVSAVTACTRSAARGCRRGRAPWRTGRTPRPHPRGRRRGRPALAA